MIRSTGVPLGPGHEREEHPVGRRVDGHRVGVVAGVLAVDRDEARLADVEDGEVAALRGDVEPAEPRDPRRARPGPLPVGDGHDGVRAAEVDARQRVVALARDERALPVGMEPHPVGAVAARQSRSGP